MGKCAFCQDGEGPYDLLLNDCICEKCKTEMLWKFPPTTPPEVNFRTNYLYWLLDGIRARVDSLEKEIDVLRLQSKRLGGGGLTS